MFLRTEYIKTVVFVFIIFLACTGVYKAIVSPDDQLEIVVVYGPEGTTQESGTITYGNGMYSISDQAKAEGFQIAYQIRYLKHRYDRLQISLGDCDGTIYLEEIHIRYHDQELHLNANEIEDYFLITGVETKEKGTSYLEIFTWHALHAKLSANDKFLTWLKEAEYRSDNDRDRLDAWLLYAEIWVLIFLIIGTKYITASGGQIPGRMISHIVLFVMVFGMYFFRLLCCKSMIVQSGDATSIWQTITSYYTDHIQSSYVLYKGMFSVYPYVWLYQLAVLFGTNEFFFVKIYNALLFAYIAAIGVPYLFEKIFGRKAVIWKKWLFAMLVFHLQAINYAYYNISVDIPSLFCFVVMMDMAVCIWKCEKNSYLYESIAGGLSAGASLCFSGQYQIGAVIGIIFILAALIQKSKIRQTIVCMVLLITCVFGIKILENRFTSQIVEPMRADGAWIPSGEEWILAHLKTEEPALASAYVSGGNFTDMQATQIISQEQPDFTQCTTAGQGMTVYFKMMLKHPVRFLTSCGNKLFLAFCMDHGKDRYFELILGYILFYVGMAVIVQRYLGGTCVPWMELLVGLAFLFTVLPSCALHMELRYAMAIQYFVYGFGIFGINAAGVYQEDENKRIRKYHIGVVLGGILFTVFCVMHYMALLD